MHIDWWTLALQAINVLILVWLLGRFLFRPVMDAIAARQAAAAKLLADAQAEKEAAIMQNNALKAQNDSFATEVEERRARLLATLDQERAALLAQARTEAEAQTRQADLAAQAERARMSVELEARAITLAGEMAARLLLSLHAAQTDKALFDALMERIEAMPESERMKLGQATPLIIVTPRALDSDTQASATLALAQHLPDLVAPVYTVEPALIAGFELRGTHVQVRNSWRADLDALLADMKDDHHARLG